MSQQIKMDHSSETINTMVKSSKNIVVITGAGISVNAGIPDFHSKKSRSSLVGSVHQSTLEASIFYQSMKSIYELSFSDTAEPSIFHHFMNRLAEEGRLLRHYTQNVDCLERLLPALEAKTVRLHGQVNMSRCNRCNWVVKSQVDAFEESLPCRGPCQQQGLLRQQQGKRHHGWGSLRPDILLYGEDNPQESTIFHQVEEDLGIKVDLVLVVGTQLKVPGAHLIARKFSQAAQKNQGAALWINKLRHGRIHFGISMRMDCDKFASGYMY